MITQADSRKWMARLYNSFLFMEAKIMKMAKKLLAVVLTGVMAVSMLTGCALSDRAAANALEKALNSTNTQPTQKVVYNYDNDLDKKAEKAFESLGNDAATRKNQLATEANKTELTYIKVSQKDYAYIVIKAPKTSDDSHAENWTVSKLHGTNGVIYAGTSLKTVNNSGATYTVKNAEKNTSATKAKVNFGVKLVNDGKDTKTYYAVVVVELTKNS